MGSKSIKTRKPTATATEFIVAAVLLLVLESVLLYQFALKPRLIENTEVRAVLSERRDVLERLEANKLNTAERQTVLDGLHAQIGDRERTLPPVLHNEDISIDIERFAKENNITLDAVSFSGRQLVDPNDYKGGDAGSNPPEPDTAATPETGAAANPETDTAANPESGVAATPESDTAANPAAQDSELLSKSALAGGSTTSENTLSVQNVSVSFTSEFHTARDFIKMFEESARKVRVVNVSLSRERESVLKGILNLEYAALSPYAEQTRPGMYDLTEDDLGIGVKGSVFERYPGYVEEGADPTILLLSGDDDIDPDFYIVMISSDSNDTKVRFGADSRVETEVSSNVNNTIRGKLTISGDAERFEYTYSLGTNEKSDRRTLGAVDGKLRLKVLSAQRMGDGDNVAVVLDVENNTDLPIEISVVNDDVQNPRFYLGDTTGTVDVVLR